MSNDVIIEPTKANNQIEVNIMAYINAEKTNKIRQALKMEFGKSIKFSVTMQHHSSVTVAIMESSVFDDDCYEQVNHYHYERQEYTDEQKALISKVIEIIVTVGGWWDKSDIQVDYFNTAFYYHVHVGKWNKPHKKI